MNISIPSAPPSCPEDLRVVDVDAGRISLAWEPPKDIPNAYTPVDGYIIEMATGVKDNFVEVARVDGNTCNYEATGLKDNKKYNFRIRPYNASGISKAFAQLDEPVIASPSVGRFSKPLRINGAGLPIGTRILLFGIQLEFRIMNDLFPS